MSSNHLADAPYVPAAGDLAWKVIKFLKENDGEELTAIDIGVKFDISPDLVADYLRRATVNEYLRKTTNRQGAAVWRLGAKPLRMTGLAAAVPLIPTPAAHRYAGRVSLPTINRNTPLMDEATRQRNEINAWLKAFEPGDSVTFQECDMAIDEMRKNVVRFRKDEPLYYFGFVQTGPGEWGMERRAEAPKLGRKKGEVQAPSRKKAK